jgi:hypothetical protein
MTTRIKTLIAATFAATLLAPTALAAAWTPAYGQTADAPRVIFAETDTGAVLLACGADGKLKTTVSSSNEDFAKRMKSVVKYKRGADVTLTVGDKPNAAETWSLMPAIDAIFTASHNQAAKLYNAAIRQEAVAVDVDGKLFTTITPPIVDATFKAFAKTCRG